MGFNELPFSEVLCSVSKMLYSHIQSNTCMFMSVALSHDVHGS